MDQGPSIAGLAGTTTGVVGGSGVSSLPTLPDKTGVYGFADQDTTAVGVHGESATGQGVTGSTGTGRGVRGEATSGVGVEAVATTGRALSVDGRAFFSRSGRAMVPAGQLYVDVTVPGGLSPSANVLATLGTHVVGVWVVATRPRFPSAGKVRIYLNAVASQTDPTAVTWFVLG